jgi:hypothetical protein
MQLLAEGDTAGAEAVFYAAWTANRHDPAPFKELAKLALLRRDYVYLDTLFEAWLADNPGDSQVTYMLRRLRQEKLSPGQ